MKRAVLWTVTLGLFSSLPSMAQNEPPGPVFEVASVRPSPTTTAFPRPSSTLEWSSRRFTASRLALPFLISEAYDLPRYRIEGGPGWMQSEEFDIAATFAGGDGRDQRRAMLRALLRERFGFVAHLEERETRVYELVLAREDGRLGPRLTRPDNAVDCESLQAARRKANPKLPYSSGGFLGVFQNGPDLNGPICDTNAVKRFLPGGGYTETMWASRRPLPYLAEYLTSVLDRPVVDRTGLTGEFDLRLEHSQSSLTTPSSTDPNVPQVRNVGPPLFTAVEEQLGLKLQSARGPVEFLIIDRVQRPTAN